MNVSMNSLPLISVVIPCFKQAKFLTDAVKSVIAQTYPHWECIIVNDGSPDDTSVVAREIIAAHPGRRLRLIEKDNDGLAEARNTAIAQSLGEWIAPLDADDTFYPQYLEKAMLLAARKPQLNHITGWLELFGAESGIVAYRPFDKRMHLFENFVPYCAIYKRTLWEKVGGYVPIIPYGAEDWNFTVTCSPWLVPDIIPEALVRYRRHSGGSMVSGVEAHMEEVNSCLHTLHPEKYEPGLLMHDHNIISSAAPETCTVIESIIDRYPSYPQPYLWRGLQRRKRGILAASTRDFLTASRLDTANDWQPWFWLSVSHSKAGDLARTIAAVRETVARCPKHPCQDLLAQLIEAAKASAPSANETNSCSDRSSAEL